MLNFLTVGKVLSVDVIFLPLYKEIIMIGSSDKLTQMQLELLKGFKHITDESQIKEIKSLLNLYFRHKLDKSIESEEKRRNYTSSIYEEWLNTQK